MGSTHPEQEIRRNSLRTSHSYVTRDAECQRTYLAVVIPNMLQGPRWPSDASTCSCFYQETQTDETPTKHKRLRGPITALHPTSARFHFDIMEAHSRGRTAETVNPRLFWSSAASKLFWSSAAPDLSRQSSSYSINYSYSILSIETLLSELLHRTDREHYMTFSRS